MKTYKTELTWGLIFVAAQLVWMLLEKMAGLHSTYIDKHIYISNLFIIPAIAVYVFGLREKRDKDLGGRISFEQAFKSGMIITMVVTVLAPFTQLIISNVITPEYFANVIEYSVRTGSYSSVSEAEAYFNLRNYITQSTIGALVLGTITTLIVGFLVRSKSSKAALS